MAFAELLERAGGVGLFQALQVFTLLLPSMLVPSQLLMENFSAAIPGHRCWVHMLDNSSEAPANLTSKALLTVSIPPGPNQEPHQCRRFRQPQWQLLDPNATATNWSEAATEPCMDGWVYDRSAVCTGCPSRRPTLEPSFPLKHLPPGPGPQGPSPGPSGACLQHRFGRKPSLSWCCLQSFLRRAVAITMLGCSYSLGQMVLGALAFTLRDWRTLQLAVSMPFFAIFLISWWLPESARWLIIVGKPDQALQELRKVARINGHKQATKSLTVEVLLTSMEEEVAAAQARRSLLDLFLVPKLRWRSWIPSLALPCSFSQMVSYYGLVMDLQNLGSDIFLLQVLFGAVDLLGRATTTFLFSFLGHRMTLASFQTMAGLSILANVLVPQDLPTLRLVFAVLGKGCFGISLTSISVYKPELYPTALRMTADGFLQSAGRLGAVTGPLIRMTRQAAPLLAPISYGVIPMASSLILLLFLPETQGLPLPDTIQDLENQPELAGLVIEMTPAAWGAES
uniref:Solute carrier family 22 member 11 n=1 Tax=Ailuropoda melanoleuca TaxID=9646 RepID=G1MHU9_AILME